MTVAAQSAPAGRRCLCLFRRKVTNSASCRAVGWLWSEAGITPFSQPGVIVACSQNAPPDAFLTEHRHATFACYLMVSFRWLSSGACLTIVIL